MEMKNMNDKDKGRSPLVLQVIILEGNLARARQLVMTDLGSRKSIIEQKVGPNEKLRQGKGFKPPKLRLQTVLISYTHRAMLLLTQCLMMSSDGSGRCGRSGR
jgi:hypothetical protein